MQKKVNPFTFFFFVTHFKYHKGTSSKSYYENLITFFITCIKLKIDLALIRHDCGPWVLVKDRSNFIHNKKPFAIIINLNVIN